MENNQAELERNSAPAMKSKRDTFDHRLSKNMKRFRMLRLLRLVKVPLKVVVVS